MRRGQDSMLVVIELGFWGLGQAVMGSLQIGRGPSKKLLISIFFTSFILLNKDVSHFHENPDSKAQKMKYYISKLF